MKLNTGTTEGDNVSGISSYIKETDINNTVSSMNEHNHRHLIDSLPVAIYACDKNGYIQSFNEAAVKLWGRTPVIGTDVWCGSSKIYNADGSLLAFDESPMALTIKNGYSIEAKEIIIERPDGERRFILPNPQPIFDNDGKLQGAINTLLDITEVKRSQQTIQESEEKLRVAIDAASLGTFDINLITDEIEYSEKYLAIYGFKPGEKPTRREVINKLHPEDMIIRLYSFDKALETGLLEYEARVILSDNSVRWIKVKGKILYDANKNAVRTLGTVIDITKEKKILRLIEESEVRLRLAIEGTMLGTWDVDLYTYDLIYSPRLVEIFGFEDDADIKYTSLRERIHPDDKAIETEALEEALKSGVCNYEARIVWPDNTLHWIKAQGNVIFDHNNLPLRMIGTVADITESKGNEEKLAKLAAIIQSSEDAIIGKRLDGIITSWNDAAERIFGHPANEMIGFSIFKIIPDDRIHEEKLIIQKLKSGERLKHFETKRLTKDKRLIDIALTVSPIKDAHGNIIGASKIARDITAQKETERLINENQHRHNIAIEAAEMGTWELNLLTGAVVYSKRYLEIFGFDSAQNPTHDELLAAVYPDDLPMRNNAIKKALETGILDIEMRILAGDSKTIKWIKSRGKVFYDDDNKPIKIMGTTLDITRQKTIFETLRQSEQRQNLALESAGMGAWDLDFRTGKVIRNLRHAQIFGYEDLTLQWSLVSMFQHLHPDDIAIAQQNIDTAKQSGNLEMEVRIIRKDKAERWIKIKANVYFDQNNIPVRMLGTLLDITEEKMNSEELKTSEEKFRLLANSMPQLVWIGDVDGNLYYFNQSVYNFSGFTKEQLDEKGWLTIVHPDDREENINKWVHAVKTGKDFLFEHRFRNYNGEYRWQLSRAIPQKDSNGKIQMWVGTSTDIHEIKESEQQKDLFISMASHELKTPITSIKGYVQILLSMYKNNGDDFLKNSLTIINKQIGILTNLIGDLLDLSKIKSGSLQLNKERFSINSMIEEVISNMQLTEPSHKFNFTSQTECELYGDKERIGQVLINFLTNAIKYSPNSNIVNIKSDINNNFAVVSVEDKGIGIGKSDQSKIFDRFYRVEGKDEKTFPGFGIGLFIASEIIKRHEGNILVDSEPGKGSVFSFLLPLENNL